MDKVKALDTVYYLYEKFLNIVVVAIIFLLSNLFYWLNYFHIGPGDSVTIDFVETILVPREGILVTVAAVFIGIYFTVFSILGSIKVDSTLAKISKNNFNKLVSFLKNAFLCAFSYLLFTILYPWLLVKFNDYPEHLVNLFLIILFLSMFLTALKVGIALIVVFKRDLKNLHESIDKEKQEKNKQDVIFQRLEKFLNEQDDIKSIGNAFNLNEVLKRKNPKK
jgi:hypothetical protein